MPITVFDAVGKFSADTRNLDEFVTKLDRALPDASQKSAVATKVLKDAQDNLRTSLKALRQEGGDTADNWNKVAAANRQVAIAAAANKQANDELNKSIGNVKESSREAKGEAALLGDMFGITLPRHVRNFIAEMPGIQTALKGAFAATAVYFLIEAMTEIPEKIKAITSDLAGWTKEAQAAYEAQKKLNEQLLEASDKREEAKAREKERGLDGVRLTQQQLNDDKEINKLQQDRIKQAGLRLGQLLQEKTDNDKVLEGWGAATVAEAFYLTARKEKSAELQKEIDAQQARILSLAKSRGDNDQQQADRASQLAHQTTADYIAQETAKTEAKRIQDNAQLEFDLALYRAQVAEGILTNQQLLEDEQKANEQRYQNDLKAAQDRAELLQKDPTKNRDAITALNAQIETMQREHGALMLALETEYTEEHKRLQALQTDPALVGELAAFNAQIEQAEQLHNGKMLKLAVDGLQAIAATKQQIQEQIDKGDFSKPIKETITLSVSDQQLVDAMAILSKLGDEAVGAAKKAGDAQAAYDGLVATIKSGSQEALGSQRLLNDSVDDFKTRLKSIGGDTTLLLGLRDVIQEEIAATEAWGGSTDKLEEKLRAVRQQLAGQIPQYVRVSQLLKQLTPEMRAYETELERSGSKSRAWGAAVGAGIADAASAYAQGAVTIEGALARIAAAQLQAIASIAYAKGTEQLAEAFGSWPDFAAMAHHFASAGLWFGLGGALSFGASKLNGGGGAGGGNGTSGAPAGTQPIATQGAAGQAEAAPAQITNVQHFATGALFTGRTMAMLGDAIGGGDAMEAAYPLEGPTADLVAEKITAKLPPPIVHVHIEGHTLPHFIRAINHEVEKGHKLVSSETRSVRRKS